MRPYTYRLFWTLISTAVFAASGFASPMNNKLLSLVPPGAEIVAGFENHPIGHKPGRLLLSTHNDRLDLDDWQALAGVDGKRIVNEVIEVAASSSIGKLTEHLLLVAGHFDKERIFNAAVLNGAERSEYEGETVILIKPFAREQTDMLDTRWLVILNDRIALFGTQLMVQRAMHRYAAHTDTDMALMERLSQMRPDVTSWNVLITAPKTEGSPIITHRDSALTRLIEGAEVLMVGTCFGSKVRVDFLLHVQSDHETTFLTQKAAILADVFAKDPHPQSGFQQPLQPRFRNISFEPSLIQGSIALSAAEFQVWSQQGGFTRPVQVPALRTPARGE